MKALDESPQIRHLPTEEAILIHRFSIYACDLATTRNVLPAT